LPVFEAKAQQLKPFEEIVINAERKSLKHTFVHPTNLITIKFHFGKSECFHFSAECGWDGFLCLISI